MTSPFHIEGPAVISFSGGRTSGYMLRRILEAHGGRLPDDVFVLFANTGKEREETLRFVHDCEAHWPVMIHWLERNRGYVDFKNASRNGEPYAELIAERKFLPNPVTRYCTTELKIRPIKEWMLAQGFETWTNVVGLRADEPRRVSRQRQKESKERWSLAFPLFDAGVTKNDVILWWKKQPFDLQLRSWEGNCDLCFLKGVAKRSRIIEDGPERAEWWIAQEKAIGATFRSDTPSYGALVAKARDQIRMFPNSLFDEAQLENDPTDLDECTGYCESTAEAA